ncbi:MAG: hypothetical protein E7230_02490 [Clostridiales bacterium]|nr:hypothetical protein [Clostridiales bacterium]
MGIFDTVKKAVNSAAPKKVTVSREISIEELYELLSQHEDEFEMPFKLSSMLGKHITFKRHPKFEIQLLVTVKGNEITIRPNIQEDTIETDGFSIRTADLKNGFGLQTELNRDDYVQNVADTIARIVG